MTPDRVKQAIKNGYFINIVYSESSYPPLRSGARFSSVAAFEGAVDEALRIAPPFAADPVHWRLETRDGLVSCEGYVYVEHGTERLCLGAELARACRDTLETPRAYSAAAIAMAKVMRHVALVLTGESTFHHADQTITRLERVDAARATLVVTKRTSPPPRRLRSPTDAIHNPGARLYLTLLGRDEAPPRARNVTHAGLRLPRGSS